MVIQHIIKIKQIATSNVTAGAVREIMTPGTAATSAQMSAHNYNCTLKACFH